MVRKRSTVRSPGHQRPRGPRLQQAWSSPVGFGAQDLDRRLSGRRLRRSRGCLPTASIYPGSPTFPGPRGYLAKTPDCGVHSGDDSGPPLTRLPGGSPFFRRRPFARRSIGPSHLPDRAGWPAKWARLSGQVERPEDGSGPRGGGVSHRWRPGGSPPRAPSAGRPARRGRRSCGARTRRRPRPR